MQWIDNTNYLEATSKDFKWKEKIASFDLDGTIIEVKSGKKFALNAEDWKFFGNKNIITNKLKELIDDNFCIVIISNQKGIGKSKNNTSKEEWKKKLDDIYKKINLPLKVYASLYGDKFRKPFPTLFNKVIDKELKDKKLEIDKNNSFYCGDACGRNEDHSDTDYKFALNNKIKFYTPEELFLGEEIDKNILTLDYVELKKSNKENITFTKSGDKELVILVGYQGSGKSYYATEILEKNGFTRINMDILKTKTKCLKMCETKMKDGHDIVIDNTNPDTKTRKEYIDLAKKYNYNITCVEIDCSKELAIHNALFRSYISNATIIPTIAFNMYKKKYKKPEKNEGFDKIIKVNLNFVPANHPDYFMYFY
jgi:bifunctional polynucleotide phosphatase/kinase